MSEQAFISIQGVSKHFDAVAAVDRVDLEIRGGEFFSVLGPSGCGKTTLLRMLAGFETPTSGEICIDGQAMSAIPAYRRPTNMVFQNYAIFPHLDVGKNISFGLRKSTLSKSAINDRVEEMLELIKLPGYASRTATELSGGERQRVALARALIMRPKVLLLDEPLGALDKNLREQMQFELRALQRSVGITFVFVTHDQEEALTLSDRIAVMAAGRVLQVDSPIGLYERPNSSFVAGFIGTTNLFHGRVQGRENGIAVVDAGPLGTVRPGCDTETTENWRRSRCRDSPGEAGTPLRRAFRPCQRGGRPHGLGGLPWRPKPLPRGASRAPGASGGGRAEHRSADGGRPGGDRSTDLVELQRRVGRTAAGRAVKPTGLRRVGNARPWRRFSAPRRHSARY